MKKLVLLIAALTVLVTAGCGSDTTVVVSTGFAPPTITAPTFTKDTTNSVIFGSVGFLAPDVDLSTITVTTMTNPGGFVVSQTITDLAAFSGMASGTIPFSIDYINFLPGTYTFTVFVVDLSGSFSNQVIGTFQVP